MNFNYPNDEHLLVYLLYNFVFYFTFTHHLTAQQLSATNQQIALDFLLCIVT